MDRIFTRSIGFMRAFVLLGILIGGFSDLLHQFSR